MNEEELKKFEKELKEKEESFQKRTDELKNFHTIIKDSKRQLKKDIHANAEKQRQFKEEQREEQELRRSTKIDFLKERTLSKKAEKVDKKERKGKRTILTFADAVDRIKERKELVAKYDKLLISFPKCGRTWIKNILSEYFELNKRSQTNEMGNLLTTHNFFDFFQDILYPVELYFRTEMYEKDIVFLIRNPFDVGISYYYQKTVREKNKFLREHAFDRVPTDLNDFLKSEMYGIERYCEFNNKMLEYLKNPYRQGNYIIISYEELSNSPTTICKKLITFLGEDNIIDAKLENAIYESSFKKMQDKEKKIDEDRLHSWHGNINTLKTRQGKIFNYKNVLDDHLIQELSNLPETTKFLSYLASDSVESIG